MDKRIFKFIEHEIEEYPDVKKTLESMEWEKDVILSSTNSDNSGVRCGTGDPTARKGIELASTKARLRAEENVRIMGNVLAYLPEEKYRLIELRYWTNPQTLTDEGIACKLNIDRSTYFRWKKEIVYLVGQKLGIAPF